jgi:hypothetical protein
MHAYSTIFTETCMHTKLCTLLLITTTYCFRDAETNSPGGVEIHGLFNQTMGALQDGSYKPTAAVQDMSVILEQSVLDVSQDSGHKDIHMDTGKPPTLTCSLFPSPLHTHTHTPARKHNISWYKV